VSFDGRTVSYTMSVNDLGAGLVLLRGGSRRSRAATFAFVAGMLALGGFVLLVLRDIVGVGLIVAAVFMIAVFSSPWLNGRMLSGALSHVIDKPLSVAIEEDGLRSSAGAASGILAWHGIHAVHEDDRVVVILLNPNASWAIIPKAAFGGVEHVRDFLQAIERHRVQARQA